MIDGRGQPDNSDDYSEVIVPQGLRDDLAALYGERVAVPAEVDAAILGMGQRRFAARRRRRRLVVRVGQGLAAAAAIGLVVWAVRPGAGPRVERVAKVAAVPGDVDGDGQVDILDALALARRIEAGESLGSDWDLNGDGVVDGADVDVVAMRAVSVSQGSV